MRSLSEVDRNFAAAYRADGMEYMDLSERPELVYGLLRDENGFCRIPRGIAEQVNRQVSELCRTTAGGRVRFRTDSDTVALSFTTGELFASANLSMLAAAGFDLYERLGGRWLFRGCFPPPEDGNEVKSTIELPHAAEHELLIHFPLYASVERVLLGVREGSFVREAPYRSGRSFVIYGSSITQGGCASRPGTAFVSIVSRRLDMDCRNLGFSSGARGETTMAEYLSGLPCDVLILDYDHNAQNAAHLARTHEPFYRMIRQARPELPILFASAPVAHPEIGEWAHRREIIRETYEAARARGERVRFLDGSAVFPEQYREECMADRAHPADIGMAAIADGLCTSLYDICTEIMNLSRDPALIECT